MPLAHSSAVNLGWNFVPSLIVLFMQILNNSESVVCNDCNMLFHRHSSKRTARHYRVRLYREFPKELYEIILLENALRSENGAEVTGSPTSELRWPFRWAQRAVNTGIAWIENNKEERKQQPSVMWPRISKEKGRDANKAQAIRRRSNS